MTISPRADDPLVALGSTGSPSVPRSALVERLRHARQTVVVLSGPAGAGKTTLVEQWVALDARPHQLLRLATHLDDPAVLADVVVGLMSALGPSERSARAVVTGLEPTFSSVVLPGLARMAATRVTPYVLVLDDLHLVRDPDCIRIVRTLAEAAPPGSALALLSRESTPRWLARLRAEDRLLEITTHDLAFDTVELAALLTSLDVSLSVGAQESLLRRTEGWAVALYLEALALRRSGPGSLRTAPSTAGDLAFARDYIEDEILAPLTPSSRDFLVRTSLLDEISPGACDAVLGRTDSAVVLDGLCRATRLVTAVDSQLTAYRYHHLLHETARTALTSTVDASTIAEMHARAAAWLHRQGDIDATVRHASLAGDVEATADVIWPQVVVSVTRGHPDRLARWLDDLPESDVKANPLLSQAAAWSSMQLADLDAMRRWILCSEVHAGRGWRDRVKTEPYAATLATLEAIVGHVELHEMAALCADALDGLRRDDPFRAPAAFVCGVALTLLRDPGARPMLLEAYDLARALDVPLIEADTLSWQGLMSIMAGDVSEGTGLISRAIALIEQHDLVRLVTSAHPITAQAFAHALRQEPELARTALATSRRLTVAGSGIAPWFHVCGRLVQAQTALFLGEAALARMLLSEARAALTPDLAESLAMDLLESTEELLAATASQASSLAPLTPAEMRVLAFLPSHLTFRQIGEHLFLSATTVKTHALSIYRKLGVSSRNDAVSRAQSLGLVESPMHS
ncbi:MAG: LuxR C-terminal-related transcriptional regulator [Nocardioides sp.]